MKSKKRRKQQPKRICPCGRIIKQKYFKKCVQCRSQDNAAKKENKPFALSLKKLVRKALG